MTKLLRPYIPVEVRCRVVMRQLTWGQESINQAITQYDGHLNKLLNEMLRRFGNQLGVTVDKLHLDHDPALENREKLFDKILSPNGLNAHYVHVGYLPNANDPDHLIYREGGFRGSAHDIKTRVRGERGQFADNVIAKRERKRLKKLQPKRCSRCHRNLATYKHLCNRCLRMAMRYRDSLRKKYNRRKK